MVGTKVSGTKQDFDADLFETRLENLKDTQDGIQQMSAWCLQHRNNHKKIVSCWLNVLKKVRVEHRLILFYLANDVVQNSKRKRYDFVESWATALQRATTMVRDEKVKNKIFRIFQIWEERDIYSEEYLSDLRGLLSMNPSKKSQNSSADVSDFQNSTLISKIRECVGLALLTDKSFKNLPKAPTCDIEHFKALIKDKSHSDDVEKEIEQYMTYVETYNKNLAAEIKSRKLVISNLDTAMQFYASQRVDVKVVVSAYKNFGSRIKLVKKKLDEITPNLASPIPSPDINAPSPEPDTDLTLPDEQPSIPMNIFKTAFNGYSSYLDGNLPFDINDFKRDENNPKKNSPSTGSTTSSTSQPIEVIESRGNDQNNREYYKPDVINSFASVNTGNNMNNGSRPIPVPTVQSEYSSLAQAAASTIPYASNSITHSYGGSNSSNISLNLNDGYNPMVPSYGGTSTYMSSNSSNRNFEGSNMPLLPPPMPPTGLGGQQTDDFNSTWDMDMTWNSLDTTNSFNHIIDTPISPPRFDQERLDSSGTIEYSEHTDNMVSLQDVDHRQLHLPPSSSGPPLKLSHEKTRQLDIDHRNLISLTGSPNTTETISKYSWLSSTKDKDFRNNQAATSGDTDYRSAPVLKANDIQTIKTIDTVSASTSAIQPPPMPPGLLTLPPGTSPNDETSDKPPANLLAATEKSSPQKNAGTEAQKEDTSYDPNDLVESIDMDMSDEDLDDLFREVITEQKAQEEAEQNKKEVENTSLEKSQDAASEDADENDEKLCQEKISVQNGRPPLLENPEYGSTQNVWDEDQTIYSSMNSMETHNSLASNAMNMMDQETTQHQQSWVQAPQYQMQGDESEQMYCAGMSPIPPSQQHMQQMHHMNHQQFQTFPRGSRGVGRGFNMRNFMPPPHSPQNPFRNAPRYPRGSAPVGPPGVPFYNRGRGTGARSPFRGKFRGNNTWI